MSFIASILPYIQIVLSIVLVALVVVQRSEAGLGSAFGGDGFSSGHHARRGLEKVLFNSTIVIAGLFIASAFFSLFV